MSRPRLLDGRHGHSFLLQRCALLALLGLAACSSATHDRASSTPIAGHAPVTYESLASGFSAQFPIEPEVEHTSQQLETGKAELTSVTANLYDRRFQVLVARHPSRVHRFQTADSVLRSVEIFIKGAKMKLLGEQIVSLGGHRARHWMATVEGAIVEGISIATDRTIYTALVFGPAQTYDQADFDRFVASFRLFGTAR